MLVDQARLKTLGDDVGAEFLPDVIEMTIEEMDDAMAGLDPPDAAKMHFLKGSALNAGLTRLGDRFRDAEAALKADPAATVDLAEFRRLYDDSRAALMDHMTHLPT